MQRLLAFVVLAIVILGASAGGSFAECDAVHVSSNIQGVWKVNSASVGSTLGALIYGKPQVIIGVTGKGIMIDGQGPFGHGGYAVEVNPRGGFWCGFLLADQPARIAYTTNRWWVLEIGRRDDRRKIELARR